jgi:hypothetical protein
MSKTQTQRWKPVKKNCQGGITRKFKAIFFFELLNFTKFSIQILGSFMPKPSDNNNHGVMKINQETASISVATTTKVQSEEKRDNLINKNKNRTHLSIATQTDDHSLINCDKCGNQMQCWNCDKSMINLMINSNNSDEIESENKNGGRCEINNGAVAGTMIGNKGDLLLQAIQRTGHAHSMEHLDTVAQELNNNNNSSNKSKLFNNLNSNKSINSDKLCERSECDTNNLQFNKTSDFMDCRECKRQKTEHTTQYPGETTPSSANSSYRRTMSECLVGLNEMTMLRQYFGQEESASGPNKNRKCMDANAINEEDLKCGEMKKYRRAFSEDTFNLNGDGEELEEEQEFAGEPDDDDDCILIKCHCPKEEEYKTTPIANLQSHLEKPLKIQLPTESCISTSSSVSPHKKQIIVNKMTPKINLAKVFNQDDSGVGMDSPDGNNNQEDVFNFNKSQVDSFSYPPGAQMQLQLSPRFIMHSMKRRSRHLSDRSSLSERSSIGSDEHLSDDDYHYLMQLKQEPAEKPTVKPTTVNKISLFKKFATKSHVAFNKLPLLGSLEESLLNNRFQPKSEVSGFKVLLGASGNFCPTQLTIPAQSYFYEFHGQQHMSTPYVVSCF